MKKEGEPINSVSLMARMIVEDTADVRNFFFGSITPKNPKEVAKLAGRIETIKKIATDLVVN